jgi:hypothetical protein
MGPGEQAHTVPTQAAMQHECNMLWKCQPLQLVTKDCQMIHMASMQPHSCPANGAWITLGNLFGPPIKPPRAGF